MFVVALLRLFRLFACFVRFNCVVVVLGVLSGGLLLMICLIWLINSVAVFV